MAFDVQGAMQAGYSEREIADFLAQDSGSGFDAAGARNAGYSDNEIIAFLMQDAAQAEASKPSAEDMGLQLESPEVDLDDMPGYVGAVESTSKAMSNLPRSFKEEARGLVEAVTDPIGTAQNVGRLMAGGAQKAWRGLGGETDGEYIKYADALADFYASRYGSIEAARKTFEENPAALLSDITAILSGGGGALAAAGKLGKAGNVVSKAGKALNTAAKYTDPLTPLALAASPATSAVGAGAKKAGEFFSPERIYERAMKIPPRSVSQKNRDRAIEAAVRERIPLTKGGQAKLDNLIGGLGDEIQSRIKSPALANVRIDPLETVIRAERDVVPQFRNQVAPGQDMKAIGEVMGDMLDSHGGMMTLSEAQSLKQGTYKAQNKRAWDERQGARVEAEKALARALKRQIDEKVPGIRALNARQGDLLELAHEFEPALNRTGNHSLFNMVGPTGAGAGLGALVAGPLGATVGGTIGAIGRTPWAQSQLAFRADDLRKLARATKGVRKVAKDSARLGRSTAYVGSILDLLAAEDEKKKK